MAWSSSRPPRTPLHAIGDGGHESREQLGFLVAVPVAAGFWLAAAFTYLAIVDGPRAAAQDLPALLIGAVIVGVPVSAIAVIALAGPLFALLVYFDRVRPLTALFGGALIGVIVVVLFNRFINGGSLLTPALGAVVGTATAATWWVIARPMGRQR